MKNATIESKLALLREELEKAEFLGHTTRFSEIAEEIDFYELKLRKKNMINHGPESIWMTGSRITVKRNMYQEGEKYYIEWYGGMIEVDRRGYTVEKY